MLRTLSLPVLVLALCALFTSGCSGAAIATWFVAHWPEILAAATLILPTLITGLSRYPRVQNALRAILDVLSIVTHDNSPGTFKLPFVRSQPPADAKPSPTSPAGGAGPTLLAIALLTLCTSGCAAFRAQPVALQRAEADALKCGVAAVQSEMKSLSPVVLDALAGDSPDWRQQLTNAEVAGGGALVCAVAHALYDALGGDLSAVAEVDLECAVEMRLALVDATAASVPPRTPRDRVLARGLAYLKEKRAVK